METEPPKLMTPFDCQTTPQWLYMLKLMLPYTPDNLQHSLAVFIRFQEMQYTLKHFNRFSIEKSQNTVLNDIKPYMDSSVQEMMEQMESMMNMMEMMNMAGIDFPDLFNMKGDLEHE